MTTKEAIQAMLDGKKVRNKTWSSYIYMYFDGDILVDSTGIAFNNLTISFTDDYELYEEPKQVVVVVIEKWLIKTASDSGFKVIEASIDFFESHFSDTDKIKLLETYEVGL